MMMMMMMVVVIILVIHAGGASNDSGALEVFLPYLCSDYRYHFHPFTAAACHRSCRRIQHSLTGSGTVPGLGINASSLRAIVLVGFIGSTTGRSLRHHLGSDIIARLLPIVQRVKSHVKPF
jgi:hypothetical protein